MKKKGYAKGGAMKKKGYAKGGAMKKPIAMKKGSKLRMVEKDGKKVPFFAADGVGKMNKGGTTKPKKRPAAMVKPKPRPGSAKTSSTRKKGDRAGVTAKKLKPNTTSKKIGKAISKAARVLSPVSGAAIAGAAAKKATKKMGGGMMKKKGYAAGGVVKKKTPKPAANYSQVGKYIPKGSQPPVDKRPAGKLFVPATKAQLEKMRADKRRAERKKSGQLDQAKKKARKTAVKAMRGGMMKKKGYAKGGSVARGSGAARPQRFTRNG